MGDQNRNGVQVIARAAQILNVLKDHPNGLSLGDIAKTTGLARSTVQRIVGALQDEDYIITDGARSGLRLGRGIGRLATAISHNMIEQCRQILFDLTQATSETADLSVFRTDKMVFLDQVPGTQRLTTLSAVGEVFPLTTTANGKASLAQLSREKALRLARKEVKERNGEFDLPAFSEMLNEINRSHLSYDLGENNEDVSAVGFAFTSWNSEVYAISLPVPSSRFIRNRPKIESAMRAARKQAKKLFVDTTES